MLQGWDAGQAHERLPCGGSDDPRGQVGPRNGYRVWLRYSDGSTGEVDLSDLIGKGVFRAWGGPGFYDPVLVERRDPPLPGPPLYRVNLLTHP